jgi:hypothetical protein
VPDEVADELLGQATLEASTNPARPPRKAPAHLNVRVVKDGGELVAPIAAVVEHIRKATREAAGKKE